MKRLALLVGLLAACSSRDDAERKARAARARAAQEAHELAQRAGGVAGVVDRARTELDKV